MRTKGFCSTLLRCGWLRRNKVDRGKARVCHFGPYREYRKNEAAPNKFLRYAIQSSFTLSNVPSKFQLQRFRRSWDHPFPVTPTRIFTQALYNSPRLYYPTLTYNNLGLELDLRRGQACLVIVLVMCMRARVGLMKSSKGLDPGPRRGLDSAPAVGGSAWSDARARVLTDTLSSTPQLPAPPRLIKYSTTRVCVRAKCCIAKTCLRVFTKPYFCFSSFRS